MWNNNVNQIQIYIYVINDINNVTMDIKYILYMKNLSKMWETWSSIIIWNKSLLNDVIFRKEKKKKKIKSNFFPWKFALI